MAPHSSSPLSSSRLAAFAGRALLCAILGSAILLTGCDRSVDQQLAEHDAAETSLGVTPAEFAKRFNDLVPDVLEDLKVDDPDHMARMYLLDEKRLHPGKKEYLLETTVGPAQTSFIGTLNKKGELKAVGVLLAAPTQAARDEFMVCAESAARSFVSARHDAQILPMLNRLVGVALNNPGQRMTEVVAERLFSVEVVPQGVLFQVQQQQ